MFWIMLPLCFPKVSSVIAANVTHHIVRSWRVARDEWQKINYSDVIISVIASQITSLTIVYSTVYSGADQRSIKAPRHWSLWGEFPGDGWIPPQRTSNAENVFIWWRHHVSADPRQKNEESPIKCNGYYVLNCQFSTKLTTDRIFYWHIWLN